MLHFPADGLLPRSATILRIKPRIYFEFSSGIRVYCLAGFFRDISLLRGSSAVLSRNNIHASKRCHISLGKYSVSGKGMNIFP